MRRKNQGTLLIVVGVMLIIFFPVSSVSNGIGSIGLFFPYDPLSYWMIWLIQYGVLSIIMGIIGVYFIVTGYRYRKWYREVE